MRPSRKSLADFPFPGSPQAADLSYLVLFTFLAFWLPSILVIFPKWLESFTTRLKVLFQPLLLIIFFSFQLWFLVVQLLCSWMFALYFLIPHCMTGAWDPIVLLNCCGLIWTMLCAPGILGLYHSLGSQPSFLIGLLFDLLILADWAFLLLYGI